MQKKTSCASYGIWTIFIVMVASLLAEGDVRAEAESFWQKASFKASSASNLAKPTLQQLAQRHHDLFSLFLEQSLQGQGKAAFQHMAEQVRNNITWRDTRGRNAYNEAFRQSFSFASNLDLQGMPESIMLIPYLESQWQGKKGRKAADYGYWQLVPDVVREIQSLDYVEDTIKHAPLDGLREDAALSTRAAQVHLHRYHFYFSKVAKFSESDAWLFTFTAFNWGAGNVKRLIAEMQDKGMEVNFASFYHYLYTKQQQTPGDKSMKAAVEYVPSLWNIARLLKAAN